MAENAEKTANSRSRISETLAELFAGIAAAGLLCQGTIVWLVRDRLSYSTGLWIGVFIAAFLAWHMQRGIESALALDETGAQKVMRTQSLIRYAVVVVILGILMSTEAANPLAAFLGVMTLKVAAYLQPVTHKVISKLRR